MDKCIKKTSVLLFISVMLFSIFCFSGCKKKQEEPYETENITVYLKDGLTEDELEKVEAEIKSIKGVNDIKFISKKDALEMAKEKLGAENVHLLDQYTENSHPFPAYYEFTIRKSITNEGKVKELKKLEGIKAVEYGSASSFD